uniref:Uncharacterized protein n=1 Tax=Rhizophora mucronata TaxID=61149 RepID=A0A2P2N3A2_RHIMU
MPQTTDSTFINVISQWKLQLLTIGSINGLIHVDCMLLS